MDNTKIYLISGAGGVGKTTLSASLGLYLAKQGHKTLILTVDPARRLAQALGIKPLSLLTQEVLPNQLWISMLNTQNALERIFKKWSTSQKQQESILNHPIFKTMMEYLGGTHEYAAMEQILDFYESNAYDKIVVDTPPSQNAVELFTAPKRLMNFLDSSVVKFFHQGAIQKGSSLAFKFIQKFFGMEFLKSFSEFLMLMGDLTQTFHKRQEKVFALLRSGVSQFFLVSYPSEVRLKDSLAFIQTLKEQDMKVDKIILNRVLHFEGTMNTPLQTYLMQLKNKEKFWTEKYKELNIPLTEVPLNASYSYDTFQLTRVGQTLLS